MLRTKTAPCFRGGVTWDFAVPKKPRFDWTKTLERIHLDIFPTKSFGPISWWNWVPWVVLATPQKKHKNSVNIKMLSCFAPKINLGLHINSPPPKSSGHLFFGVGFTFAEEAPFLWRRMLLGGPGSWGRCPVSWKNLLPLKDNQTHHRCSMLFLPKNTFSNLTWCFSIIFKFWLFQNMFLWWENMRFGVFLIQFLVCIQTNHITQPQKNAEAQPKNRCEISFFVFCCPFFCRPNLNWNHWNLLNCWMASSALWHNHLKTNGATWLDEWFATKPVGGREN